MSEPELIIPETTAAIGQDRALVLAAVTRTGDTLAALIAAWLGSFTESEHTRDAYRRDLQLYIEWCIRRDLDPLTVRLPQVQMYATEIAAATNPRTSRPYSAPTRARWLAAVSSFYTFLVRAGVLDANPARDVRRPDYDRHHTATATVNQAQAIRLKDVTRTPPERTENRGRRPLLSQLCALLALSLMLDDGLRVSEVCGANLDGLGQREGLRTITVRAKGNKTRTRPIPVQLAPLLDRYLTEERRPAAGDRDATRALLLTTSGQRVNRHQLTRMVQRAARDAGVPDWQRITAHSLRHAFNSIAAAANVPLEARQRALGHSSPVITQLYDHTRTSIHRDPAHLVAAATAPHDEQGEDHVDHGE